MPVDLDFGLSNANMNFPTKTQNDNRYINVTGDEMTGDLNMNNQRITNLRVPQEDSDAVNKIYVNAVQTLLEGNISNIANQTRINDMDMNQYKILRLGEPVAIGDAATKRYVDQQLNTIPLTASGSTMDLNLNNFKMLNVSEPTHNHEGCNKAYVDKKIAALKIINPQTPGYERYSDYLYIKETFKPTFWISGYYNSGLQIINDNDYLRLGSTLVELTGNGYVSNGDFSYINQEFRFENSNAFNIISRTTYSKYYTFFAIMSQDATASGRLFTSDVGNRLFGFWKNQYGSLWIDENVNLDGKGVNDGAKHIFTLRNDNKKKTAFINNEQYISSSAGANDWGKVVIGRSTTVPGESGSGNVLEIICFNKALSDGEITTVFEKLVKYYP